MPTIRPWPVVRVVLLGVILALAVPSFLDARAQSAPTGATAVYEKGDSKDRKEKKEQDEKQQQADRVLNGQVLDIDTLKNPPELIIGSVDGQTVVRVLKTDEIALNGVHLGDYIEADGEKINEQLFEAQQLSVSSRYSDAASENDNSD